MGNGQLGIVIRDIESANMRNENGLPMISQITCPPPGSDAQSTLQGGGGDEAGQRRASVIMPTPGGSWIPEILENRSLRQRRGRAMEGK